MKKTLLVVLLTVFYCASLYPQCATNVDFNTWTPGGQPGNGNWVVQGGGSQVHQTVNGNPSFFLTPYDLMNVHLTGLFKTTDNDDDYMGFVWSFFNPMGATDTFDCYLFDWKQAQQGAAPSGMSVNRVLGVIPAANYQAQFWNHTNSPEFTVLWNNFGGNGWTTNYDHQFDLLLTYSSAQIFVDGNLVFSRSDCYLPGRFGFYNLSQQDCYYSGFSYSLYVDFMYPQKVCKNGTANFNFINPSCVQGPLTQYQSITWDYGDGTPPVVINNPTSANANGTHIYSAPGNYTVTLTVLDNNNCTATATHQVQVANQITLAPTLNQPPCNGGTNGSISVVPSGGFGPFFYNWSNGQLGPNVVGLAAGTYTVTVTDNICNSTAQYTINQPTALTATTSHTDASCGLNNGSATIAISGGTPPYAGVNWIGIPGYTVTGLGPGTYIADFHDANGCSSLLQYTETISSLPCGMTSSVAITPVNCYGASTGSATLTVTGGTPPQNVSWSSGATGFTANNLAAGTYTYSYSDGAGASHNFTGTVTITQPGAPMAISLATVGVACSGNNSGQAVASVNSGGNSPYTYTWSGGQANNPVAANLSPGNITVTVTDNKGCTATATGTVSGVPSLAANITTVIDSCYHSGKGKATAHVTGGVPPYSFSWSNFVTDSTTTNLIAGTYTVTITDNNACSITASATITGSPPFTYTHPSQDINCYGANNGSINITATGGVPGYSYTWNQAGVSGNNPTGLAPGIYEFTITDTYGCTTIGGDTLTQPDSALYAYSSHTNVTCNGANNGSITVTIGGGTAPYTYQSLTVPAGTYTQTGLAANTYNGTVTDANGCTVNLSETITEPGPQSLSITPTNSSCAGGNNGSITASFVNATGAVSYNWNPGGVLPATRTNLAPATYSITATDANTCTVSGSVAITEPGPLNIPVTAVDAPCFGANGSATANYNGGTAPYNYTWSNSAPNQQTIMPPAGSYTITATDAGNCIQTGSFTINQPTQLTVQIQHTDVACFGASTGTVTVTPAGGTGPNYTYTWSPNASSSNTATNVAAGTYNVTVTDQNSCSITATATVTQPAAALNATPVTTNITCNGANNGKVVLNTAGGTVPYAFTWSPNVSTLDSAINLSANTYNVTITDANNCTLTQTATVTEPVALSLTQAQTNLACYHDNSGTASVTPAGGTGSYTYTWNPNVSSTSAASSLAAGTYNVTVGDANLCTITATFTLTEPPAVVLQIQQTDVNCFGDATGSITVTASGGTGPNYTYAWSPNISASNTATALTAGNYIITVTDQINCSVDSTITISQPAAALAAAVTPKDVTCFGAGNGKINLTVTGGTPAYGFTWNPNVSSVDSAINLVPGTYDVTVTDAKGCTVTQTTGISEPTALALTQTQTNLSCYQDNTGAASVSVTGGTGAYTYAWSPNVSTSNSAANIAAGNYTVTTTDANLCTITAAFVITQPSQLQVTEVHTNNACAGNANGTITLTVNGGTPGYTYSWTPNVSTTNTASGLASGNYTYVVTDTNNCSVTQSVSITEPAPLVLTVTATNITCFGLNDGTVTATNTGGTSPFNYIATPDGVNFQSSANGLFSAMGPGTYIIVVADGNACTDTASATISEPNQITGTVTPTDVTCFGYTDGQVMVSAAGGVGGFTYNFSNGAQNTSGTFNGLPTGSYDVTITDANGCSITGSGEVNEPPAVTVSISPDPAEVDMGDVLTLTATTNQSGVITYNWAPASGLSCSDCAAPVFEGVNNTVYTLTVTNGAGCTGTAQASVTIVPNYDLFIPNAFTPNGDGTNDLWQPYGKMSGIKQMQVMVFNRIGEKVFESNDINFGWDGTYKGAPAPAGVYTYVAAIVWINNHSDNKYKGSLTLIR